MHSLHIEFRDDDIPTYAASLAYHGMLALLPFLLAFLAVVNFLDIDPVFDRLLIWANAVLPPRGMEIITRAVMRFEKQQTGLISLGLIGALWAVSGGVRSAMNALNRVYDIQETRSSARRYLMSLAFTIGIGAFILGGLGLMLLGTSTFGWLGGVLGFDPTLVWSWIRYPVAIVLMLIGSALGHSLLPNQRPFRLLTAGSVLAVALWILASIGFRLYLAYFGRYDVIYGSLGAVIVLLLYLWLSAMAFLIGAEVDAVNESHIRRCS